MDDEDMKEFSGLADDNGEISKTDLIVHTKASKFWKEYMQAKAKPGGLISKVPFNPSYSRTLPLSSVGLCDPGPGWSWVYCYSVLVCVGPQIAISPWPMVMTLSSSRGPL